VVILGGKDLFMRHLWIILAIGLFLSACSASDPEGKDTSGAVDVAVMKNPPKDAEGSFSKTAPPLTDQQMADAQLEEGSGTALDDHPNLATYDKVERQLVLPKTVEGKWKAVKILVRDKTDDEFSEMKQVDLGQSFTLANGTIQVRASEFLPNFVLTQGEVTSLGNELKNPAVKRKRKRRNPKIFSQLFNTVLTPVKYSPNLKRS